MKKILALVMALAMVLGLASVASAAWVVGAGNEPAAATATAPDYVITKEPTLDFTVAGNPIKDDVFTLNFASTKGEFYRIVNYNQKQGTDSAVAAEYEATVTNALFASLDGAVPTVQDDKGNVYVVARVGATDTYTVTKPAGYTAGATKVIVTGVIFYVDAAAAHYTNAGVDITRPLYKEIAKVADAVEPQAEIKKGLADAIATKSLTASFNVENLTDKIATSVDFNYITNTWFKGDWYPNFNYLAIDLRFYNPTTNTVWTIKAADLDYTWNKLVDFSETTGLVKYDKKTEAEMYNIIRAITGDTKNPYTFGFAMVDNHSGRGTSVPTMTISKVVPQQWINYYGHKNLELFAWDAGITCDNWAHNDPKVLATTTLDAVTLTQRVDFVTSDLYRTLVLSKGVAATDKPADGKTDDANPNTGANDIVNVAIVFAVVSLAAAGAFVFKKAK